jgi:5'-methylthioadenosine phosphorylase
MEGPAFSTKAESNLYRSWGMDIIGMTNLQEAKLAREAEICYSTIAMVTDYDCWHPEHDTVSVADIIRNLTHNAENAAKVVAAAVRLLTVQPRSCACSTALATALITDRTTVPSETYKKLELIVGKYFAG